MHAWVEIVKCDSDPHPRVGIVSSLHRDRSERARLDPELLAELLFLGGETVWRNVGRETAENYGLECALV